MALVCDTGPLYSAIDRLDQDHEACARLLEEIDEPVVVPAPVLVELDFLLASRRLPPDAFLGVLADVEEGQLTVVDVNPSDYSRIRELLDRYRDLELGFVDAAVLAAVERLKESKLATLDRRHFTVVRPRHVPALRLLP